jgi:uncharacterized protein (DUF1810 family)
MGWADGTLGQPRARQRAPTRQLLLAGDWQAVTNDNFELERFVAAQTPIYPRVLDELRAGRKRSHWMWFIFPQITGLGSSETAQRYALSGGSEAVAYLEHPLLGPRLRECTALVNAAPLGRGADEIFGYPDDLKFRSSMTLFHAVAPDEPDVRIALDRYFAGRGDERTLQILGK